MKLLCAKPATKSKRQRATISNTQHNTTHKPCNTITNQTNNCRISIYIGELLWCTSTGWLVSNMAVYYRVRGAVRRPPSHANEHVCSRSHNFPQTQQTDGLCRPYYNNTNIHALTVHYSPHTNYTISIVIDTEKNSLLSESFEISMKQVRFHSN